MNLPITVIIPFSNLNNKEIQNTLDSLFKQNRLPNELIIVLTKKKVNFNNLYKKKISKLGVKVKIIYKKNAYPGLARNIGIINSKNSYIAFLDHKTVPPREWLFHGFKKLKQDKSEIILGQTLYFSKNLKDEIMISSTVGKKLLETLPGTILKKNIFLKSGMFIENVRSGEDGDWFRRLKTHNIKLNKNKFNLTYLFSGISIHNLFKKWYLYYKASANLDQLQLHKQIYLLTMLTFVMLFIYNWNFIFADWDQNSKIYIHHITKKSVLYMSILYVFLRGILMPVKKGVKLNFLLPINFLFISCLSLCLDLIKTWCYNASYFKKK